MNQQESDKDREALALLNQATEPPKSKQEALQVNAALVYLAKRLGLDETPSENSEEEGE